MNFFAHVAKDLVWFARKVRSGLITAGNEAPKVLAEVQKNQVLIEGITAAVAPGATAVENTAFSVLGASVQAIKDGGLVASANGLNLTLDQQLVADIRAIIPHLDAHAAKSSLVPTAPLAAVPVGPASVIAPAK